MFQIHVFDELQQDLAMPFEGVRRGFFGLIALAKTRHVRGDDAADAGGGTGQESYELAAYFYSRDIGRIFRVGEALEYGIVGVNVGIIANEVAPFGGVKQSGIGRELGPEGLDPFTELQSIILPAAG